MYCRRLLERLNVLSHPVAFVPVLLLPLAVSSPVSATQQIDQEHMPTNSLGGLEVTANQAITQTFTVGISGTLTRVDITEIRHHRCTATADLLFQLVTTAGGVPTTIVLANMSVPASSVPPLNGPLGVVSIDIASFGVEVSVGDVLAIVLSTAAPGGGCTFAWNGDIPGTYGPGSTFLFGSDNLRDMAFRTWVEPPVCIEPPEGLVAWWTGDRDATDIVGGNHGTLEGGPTFEAGRVGHAIIFNGANAINGTTGAQFPLGSSPRTITAWVKPEGLVVPAVNLFHYGVLGPPPPGNFHLYLSPNPVVGNGEGHGVVGHSTQIYDGAWHFLAGVYEGPTTDIARIYVDDAEANFGTITTPATRAGSWRMGSFLPGDGHFAGGLDEVMLFDRALSEAEIRAIFNAGSAGVCTGPETKLTASDAAAGQAFGWSVAISGDSAVVGAAIALVGSAHVFERSGTRWSHQAKLAASDPGLSDHFGFSADISGNTIVVGAPLDDHAGGTDAGSAYVFERCGTGWIELAKLTASDAAAGDAFGYSVAISGETILVGARFDDGVGADSGAAYVFERSGTSWVEQVPKLTAHDAAAGDAFGHDVDISGDTALVGAFRDDDAGPNSGSAYVFERSGTSWIEVDKLTSTDAKTGDGFGISVAISADTIVIGRSSFEGAAYVFERSGTGWTQGAPKLTASDAAVGGFGGAVAISGNTIVVGNQGDDYGGGVNTLNTGSAYVFKRSGSGWLEREPKLTASDAAPGDFFGFSVATNGDTVVVGARFNDDAGAQSGSAYVYELGSSDPPIANAGADQSIHAGETVFLDGSGSFDDNTSSADLTYQWTLTTPAGSTAILAGEDTPGPTFFADLPGTYVAQLEVTDEDDNLSEPDGVTISSTNVAPTADAGPNQGAVTGILVTLDGTGSSDPEDPLTFAWTLLIAPTGSTAALSGADTANPFFTPDLAGSYSVQLVVHDGFVASAPGDVLILAVTPGEFAENNIGDGLNCVLSLPPTSVTTAGNQTALGNFLTQALEALQVGDTVEARNKLTKALSRTDGCALRGEPDGKGRGRDWITDCAEQTLVYNLLNEALAALSP